jgi:hypothetical protein
MSLPSAVDVAESAGDAEVERMGDPTPSCADARGDFDDSGRDVVVKGL